MRAELFGFRTGTNTRGVRPATLARWIDSRERLVEAWMACNCSYAETARLLGRNPGTVWRGVRRALDGPVVAALARKDLAERLARQRARRNWNRKQLRDWRKQQALLLNRVEGESGDTNRPTTPGIGDG